MEYNKKKNIEKMISLVEAASRRLEYSIKDLQKIRTSSMSLFSKDYPATYFPGKEMILKEEISE